MLKDWAFQIYRDPLVAKLCEQLQDEQGVQVCELLWVFWLEQQQLAPEEGDLTRHRRLHRGLYKAIERLRGARRLLKLEPLTRDLGQRVQTQELEAEVVLLSALEALDTQRKSDLPGWWALHNVNNPLGLAPSEAAQKLYTALAERIEQASVEP